jgi:hypothetical protein
MAMKSLSVKWTGIGGYGVIQVPDTLQLKCQNCGGDYGRDCQLAITPDKEDRGKVLTIVLECSICGAVLAPGISL